MFILNKMFHSLLTLVLSFSVSSTLAQVLIPNTLPNCGQQCPTLITAQAGCVPPAAPNTSPDVYQSCFCLSDFLKPLKIAGSNICPTCSQEDMATIEKWFQTTCATPDQAPPNQGPPDQAPPVQAPPDQAPPAAQPAAPTSAANSNKGGATISEKPPPNNKGWSVCDRLM